MKSLAYLTLVFSAVHTGLLRERQTCPQVCATSQCPAPPHACYYGQVKDACACCVVCAAGEGEACGKRSSGHLSCGNGLRCDSGPGKAGGFHSLCVCASSGPVCGSDGRTYPSICRLRAENRRAELGETSPVFLIQRGRCDSGKLWDISFGLISHLCCFPLSFLFSLKRDLCITDMKQQLLKLKL